ncbi:putative secreted protein (Por secretion system target) [Flavobacteriaceae bacterium MAR_2010_105]|nr:putative secreted protein (Por secretion system target) [Flavobacteriaceae bacterium MAR_2010_105]
MKNLLKTVGFVVALLITMNSFAQYCTPSATASTTSYINYFKITKLFDGDLLNHSSGNMGYENNNESNGPLVEEEYYRFNFGIGSPNKGAYKRVHIWIDKNQDGDFNDDGEEIFSWTGANTTTDLAFSNKSIGAISISGISRLRIAMRSSNNPISTIASCDTFFDGEIEDYSVILSQGSTPPPGELTPEVTHDLFTGSGTTFATDGVPHTYRIPSLVTTKKGTLLAIGDGRLDSHADVPNRIDFYIKRSTDNGTTWGESIIISNIQYGGDACTVVDQTTGRIFIFYAYSQFKNIFGSNGDPNSENCLRSQYIYSDDDGLTWSAPVDLTADLYKSGDNSYWASGGTGIQLRNGTLVIPIAIVRSGIIYGGIIYSTDHGETWNRSETNSYDKFDENTIVELNDGRIMVNARNHYQTGRRLITHTSDLGTTWSPFTFDPVLVDPVCQGSIIRYTSTLDGYDKNRILFSNPASTSGRKDGTLRISYDEGLTWAFSKLYQPGDSNYSSIAILPDGKIGVLYEVNHSLLRFKRFSLEDLTDGTDSFTPLDSDTCNPSEIASSTSYINYFKVSSTPEADGDLLNHSSGNTGYENNPDSNVPLSDGTSYKFNFGIGNPNGGAYKRVHIWVDKNQDGDFTDAGEEIFNWTGANTTSDLKFTNKSIGEILQGGNSVMRIAMRSSDSEIPAIDPCDTFTDGEVEDYSVVLQTGTGDYCEPSPFPSTTSYIDYFKITEVTDGDKLNHTSGNTGYEHVIDSDASLVAEKSYRFNFGIGTPQLGINKRVHVWIDKNQDGDFTDSGEEIFSWSGANTDSDLQFSNKSIGAVAELGKTRMRIAMRSSNSSIPAIEPCDTFLDGEIEDYSVDLRAPEPPLTALNPEVEIDLYVGDGIPASSNGTPHTYRIPSLVTTTNGTLLAITDIRYENASDVPGEIDMAVRRSTDNGTTWDDAITINTVHGGDACTVVDKTTGRIFIFYAYSEYRTIWTSDGDPNSPNCLRSRYIYSDDNGLTWSEPVDLTADLYKSGDRSYWASAGTGIQLRNGTLVIPIAIARGGNTDALYGGLIYSTDHGETWNRSATNSYNKFDENVLVELNDGRIMINSRNHYGTGRRLVTYTSDLGTTWESYNFDSTLIDPICQGNILRYTSTLDGYDKDRILFSNPASTSGRKNGVLRISYDEGQTWAYSKLYQSGFSAYSSLTILQDGKIGLLYESDGYTKIKFKRFNLEDLTDSTDTFTPNNNAVCILECPSDIIMDNDAGSCGAVVNFEANKSSGCQELTYSQNSGSFFNVGTTEVTVTAIDSTGNETSCTFSVTINDTEAPILSCPADTSIECNKDTGPENTGMATTTDNCESDIVITYNDIIVDSGSCANTYTIVRTFTATDGQGNSSSCTQNITVQDTQGPTDIVINAPLGPIRIGTSFNLSATFNDCNVVSATIALSSNDVDYIIYDAEVSGSLAKLPVSVTQSLAAGVYKVVVTITDECENSSQEEFTYLVIFDPNGGFVTGGGNFYSNPGAYRQDLTKMGKVNFGFIAKYDPDDHTYYQVKGSTRFNFKEGDFSFKSSSHDPMTLVVTGDKKASYRGVGTVNKSGNHKFVVVVIDGDANGGNGIDRFRIKVFANGSSDEVIYDNEYGLAENADVSTTLGGGSIEIHKENGNSSKSSKVKLAEENLDISNELKLVSWPNPTHSSFIIKLISPDNNSAVHINVFDLSNKLVHSAKTFANSEYKFGSNLQSGIYIVKINQAYMNKAIKLIKF